MPATPVVGVDNDRIAARAVTRKRSAQSAIVGLMTGLDHLTMGVYVVSLVVALGAPAHAQTFVPPRGTSYWLNQYDDLQVLRFNGKKLTVVNATSPCFVGLRTTTDKFRGGGVSSGGQYTRQTLTLRMNARTEMEMRWSRAKTPGLRFYYVQVPRKEALRSANPRPGKIWKLFDDCQLP
jgi:hypothetical protein